MLVAREIKNLRLETKLRVDWILQRGMYEQAQRR